MEDGRRRIGDARYEFEERDGRRLKHHKGQPGNYVGVTETFMSNAVFTVNLEIVRGVPFCA